MINTLLRHGYQIVPGGSSAGNGDAPHRKYWFILQRVDVGSAAGSSIGYTLDAPPTYQTTQIFEKPKK